MFDFITSKDFLLYESESITAPLEVTLPQPEVVTKEKRELIEISEDKPLPQDEKDAEQILDPELFTHKNPTKETSEKLALGTPLTFEKNEKFSFTEWLQLADKKNLEPKKDSNEKEKNGPVHKRGQNSKQKLKFARIDTFIQQNPKIVPRENIPIPANLANSGILDKNELMTETLARVYLEQKKYKKAIQAYKILSLKYPEKSSFFADRIKIVEKIQSENR